MWTPKPLSPAGNFLLYGVLFVVSLLITLALKWIIPRVMIPEDNGRDCCA